MRGLWRLLSSIKVTLVILIVASVLLLINVAVPQNDGATKEAYEILVARGGLHRFFLETLEFGRVPHSPQFIATMVAFFVNLSCVLIDRGRTTVKRSRFNPPTPNQVRSWANKPGSIRFERPEGWSGLRAAEVLKRLGYRTAQPTAESVWGIRNRTAVLGFPLFHASFFLLCAGGLALYYTRFVAMVALAEGQAFNGPFETIVREAPSGHRPELAFRLDRVEPLHDEGRPIQLGATLYFPREDSTQTSWINHPAVVGANTILVDKAGLSPVFSVQDAAGYVVDRVAVLVSTETGPTPAPLAENQIQVTVTPVAVGKSFPLREELPSSTIEVVVTQGGTTVYSGSMKNGQTVHAGDFLLVLEELRYWAKLRLVHEYGGTVLIIGFLIGVIGLVWRMVWVRREVAVMWGEDGVVLMGRSEYFPSQLKEELDAIAQLLTEHAAVSDEGVK